MKKVFLLAGFTPILFACNNNADHTASNTDTSHHIAHNNTTVSTANQTQDNPILQTMDKMMQEMHGRKAIGNNEIDFAAMMVEHHKGAVEMSKVELDKGNDPELKAFAQTVINDQNKEITFMQSFIANAPKTTSANATDFQAALNNSMMVMMSGAPSVYNHIDKDFAAQMIPHHQSAVDMAEAYLEYGQEASLRTLCQNIITSQTKEINWLQEWLAKNGK